MSKSKKPDWTPTQLQAINTNDKTLLVSAAAGSGKTATLTERIIRSVFREENPLNIEDMLIVTFTRAAAEELRARLKRKFAEVIAELPPSPRNERQLVMLGCAKICTIDSFCADILRANCDRFDLSPSFRVPDKAEVSILAENLLNGMFSEIYEGNLPEVASPDELFELCDCLTDTGRQDDLQAIIAKIHDDTKNAEAGVGALEALIAEYDPKGFDAVEQTHFGSYCMQRAFDLTDHYLNIYRRVTDEISARRNPKLDALEAQTREGLALLESLSQAREYNEMRARLLAADFCASAISVRDKTLPPTTMIRNSLKADIFKLRDRFFVYTEEDWRYAYEGLYRVLGILGRIVRYYDGALRAEKRRRGICEYSDIERYTYECMWQDGKLTDAALSERAKYSAVYIDEYQDVNNLQNKIFEAISTDTNRFMVGDIKQSIYRFRSANPEIFANMKRSFPPIDEAKNSTRAAIFMSDNFRCDRGVVDFVNIIFDKIFGCMRDSIGYNKTDALGFAKVKVGEPEPEYKKPEICLIDSSAINSVCKAAGVAPVDKLLAPAVVAEKIRELLADGKKNDGSPIRPGDIAILMRSAKGRSGQYRAALDELGIPSEVVEQNDFFATPEIQLALCLLNSIDNPHKDIYLTGLMLSPLYSFTADDLARVRQAKGESLYSSLLNYTDKNPDFERGRSFIDSLERYRMLAEGTPTDKLIMRLYHETGLLSLGARLGVKDKLIQLYDYARSFEGTSFRGLYNFIHYINNITSRKHSLDDRKAVKSDTAVNIMTVHGSKGLEFPVVFYVDLNRHIGAPAGGTPPRFEYAEGFGFGMVLRTPSGLAMVNNPTREIIKDYRHRRDIEEEARVLYVGLTRPMERLYIVTAAGKKLDSLNKELEFGREYFSPHTVYSMSEALPMLLCAHPFSIQSPDEFLKQLPEILTDPLGASLPDNAVIAEKRDTPPEFDLTCAHLGDGNEPIAHITESTATDRNTLLDRFNYRYPKEALTTLPEKLSVSVLYPEILDGTEAEVSTSDELRRDRAALRFSALGLTPKFISGDKKPTAAERGTATHLFMQFADPSRIIERGVQSELDRLIQEKFISERDAEILRRDELEVFARSELIRDMTSARRIWRELRFNVKLPAELFSGDAETKASLAGTELLVQGVIDCLIEAEGGVLRLVDYKTDRLTKAELESPELAERKLREAHSRQLCYYALATEKMFGKRPASCEVYSLALGRCVQM